MDLRAAGLWTRQPFALLWTGQTVSQLGSEITLVALPLTAIIVLEASPVQVGLLTASGFVSAALLGLFAGVWVDRLRRRPLLIASQIVLALTTASVPIAWWLGLLRLEQLFAVEAINGALKVLSIAASQAYLPAVARTDRLTEANAKLATSNAVTRIAGPGLAGGLIQMLSAPTAIVADACSFLFSAVCLMLIRVPEPTSITVRKRLFAEIHEGLYLVLSHRLIRPLMLATGMYNCFAGMFIAVYALFMVRELQLEPAMIGGIIASGGIGGVLGGLAAAPLARRLGTGRAIVGGFILLAVMHVAAPLAGGPPVVTIPLLAGAGLFAQLGAALWVVNRTSLIQQVVPAHVLGRVAATQQVLGLAVVPIGAAVGGLIGETVGLRAALAIAALGTIAGAATLLRSPLWTGWRTLEPRDAESADRRTSEPHTRSPATLWRFARGFLPG